MVRNASWRGEAEAEAEARRGDGGSPRRPRAAGISDAFFFRQQKIPFPSTPDPKPCKLLYNPLKSILTRSWGYADTKRVKKHLKKLCGDYVKTGYSRFACFLTVLAHRISCFISLFNVSQHFVKKRYNINLVSGRIIESS